MLHNVKASHGDILKGLPELAALLPTPVRKKQLLREMARRGEQRPTQKTPIGRALSQYASPANSSYDREFHEELRKLRPDWFASQTEIANQKKRELLRMAQNGEKRPSHDKTKLGQALSNYTRKGSPVYDPEFHRAIVKIRPDWFERPSRAKKTARHKAKENPK